MRKLCILGSTGSIGTQTLDIVRACGDYTIQSLTANENIKLLEKQLREFHPKLVCVYNEEKARELKDNIHDTDIRVVSGMEGMLECSSDTETDMVVTAVVGMIGIRPTIAAIESGHDIALANKETLVTAGHIIIPLAAKHRVRILPVDSEHSAIFQALQGNGSFDGYYYEDSKRSTVVDKIILTASGGPFRGWHEERLRTVRVEDALRHPNWSMGKKITIDSATMVNKGLEIIEARWLFGVTSERIEVVVQPQSIIHSAVQFNDGSIIAQMGIPDMKLPIQYALYYPKRMPHMSAALDLFKLGSITFEKPDTKLFRGIELAYDACRRGGSIPTVLNAANEFAVAAFLADKISFLRIQELISEAIDAHKYIASPSIDEILTAEQETYEFLRRRTWKEQQ